MCLNILHLFMYAILLYIGVWLAIFLIIAHLTLVMPIVLISTGIVRKKKTPIIVASAVWVPIYTVLIIFFLGFPPKYPLLPYGSLVVSMQLLLCENDAKRQGIFCLLRRFA